MTMKKVLGIVLFVLLAAAGGAESRRHPDNNRRRDGQMLFVFGDSFVDAGNIARTSANSAASRQWFYPYGSADSDHQRNPTGRLSDGLVQSDFLARILGSDESPPAHRLSRTNDVDASGVNFAKAGDGAYDMLSRQIDELSRLVSRGSIEDRDLDHSVALIAFNGATDYAKVTTSSSSSQVAALSDKVTDAIADGVRRLLDLGVSKVMVNSLPPMGCMPYMTQMFSYGRCDAAANTAADIHNIALRRKLGQLGDVLVLDIHSIFSNLARGNYRPCCTGNDERNGGYCGRQDARGTPQYTLCSDPQDFFFWDYMHPTQAGWNAIMYRLQGPIHNFLGN